jgi:transposase
MRRDVEGSSRILLGSLKGILPACEILLNWFHARGASSNGSVEGMNNTAKLTIKKTYGFKSYNTPETALSQKLRKLPEPQSTHRFC